MLEAIAKEEGLAVSQEELEAEICKYGESYGIDGKTMLEMITGEDKEALEKDMLVRAAMQLIEDTAILTDPKAE
jgi:trigger factor